MTLASLTVDGYDYTAHDARATITNLGAWWAQLAKGRECPDAFDALRAEQAALLADALGERAADAEDSLAAIERLGRMAYAAIGEGRLDPGPLLGASVRLVNRAAAELRAAAPKAATHGTLTQINISDGGVPKRSVRSATVDRSGLLGDRQAARQHHGRPWQAVCVWSADVIDGLAAEGHPIAFGSCGENLTIRGLPWVEVRPGERVAVGSALFELSLYSLPCAKNAQWFSDRDFSRIHHERGPVSRIYATVLEGGEVRAGDAVALRP